MRVVRGVIFLFLVMAIGICHAVQYEYVRLPSESTDGGTLAVKLSFPDSPAQDRYEDGAPVVTHMRGGSGAGGFPDWDRLVEQGFVVVQFNFPGGSGEGQTSDGTYDYRGPKCLLAARDVLLFTLGRKTDALGRTIDEVVGRAVHTDLAGFYALSNGGNLAPAVMDLYSEDLLGLRLSVFWENAMGTQPATGELGSVRLDCDPDIDGDGNGQLDDDGRNPRYDSVSGYAYPEQSLDYSELAWDSTLRRVFNDAAGLYPPAVRYGELFLDGNANGAYDHRPGERSCPDIDLDGAIEVDEDFPFSSRTIFLGPDQPLTHYSEPATRYLAAHPEIFPGGVWPEWVATPAEAADYWADRAGAKHLHLLEAYRRSVRTIVTFAFVPHSHVTDDADDSRLTVDGLSASGLWVRIGADSAYMAAVNGSVPGDYQENPANMEVPAGQMRGLGAPPPMDSKDLVIPALAELADRTYYGGWTPDLASVLDTGGIPAGEVSGVRFSGATSLEWDPAAGNLFYDVARGDVTALAEVGGGIDLGPLSCVEEDSEDLAAEDPQTPAAGTSWFYLLRPGGLSGTYGRSSSGSPRRSGDSGCLH